MSVGLICKFLVVLNLGADKKQLHKKLTSWFYDRVGVSRQR